MGRGQSQGLGEPGSTAHATNLELIIRNSPELIQQARGMECRIPYKWGLSLHQPAWPRVRLLEASRGLAVPSPLHPLQPRQACPWTALPWTSLLSGEGALQRAWPSGEGLPPRPSSLSSDLSRAPPGTCSALEQTKPRGLSPCSAPLPVDFRPLPQPGERPGERLSAPISPARCSICHGDWGGGLCVSFSRSGVGV